MDTVMNGSPGPTNPVTTTSLRVTEVRAVYEIAVKDFMRAMKSPGVDQDYLWACERAMGLAYADLQDALLAHHCALSATH